MKNNFSTFIINMKKDDAKLTHMKSICKHLDTSPEIIIATEGKKLKNKLTNGHHSFKSVNKTLSLGEIGCAFSHISVYKEIIKNKIPFSLILEDDINFSENIENIISEIILTDTKWDIIHIGHHSISSRDKPTKGSWWNKIHLSNNLNLSLPCEVAAGTYGYLITYNGAEKLLTQLDCLTKPIDHYTGSTQHCNLLLLSPPAITIHTFYSDNYNDMHERVKISYSCKKNNSFIKTIKNIAIFLGVYKLLDRIALKVILTVKSFIPRKKYT